MRASLLLAALVLAGCTVERTERQAPPPPEAPAAGPLLGLRSGIYHVADLAAARAWYIDVTGTQPYFDEPYYVGFDIGGFELGLDPDTTAVRPGGGGGLAYWGVADADSALARLLELGAAVVEPVADAGGGVRHAVVRDPFGNYFGIIENPRFAGRR
ncbi:MAG TPA: VOC family protein [Longimicrobiales bacterium]|nr:VOC family protein [Longimicrobiales bacterium]